jgi:AcrR family transcriptional regulator
MNSGEGTTDPATSGDRRARRTRRYRSRLREDRAADTRRRIAIAARELFTQHGFAGATVAGIAERAGVSAPTVYATFGSKGGVLRALLAQLEEDADAAGWRARIDAEPDPHRKLDAFAAWTTAMFSTSRAVIAAAQGASDDPAMTQLRRQGDQHRREALRRLLSAMADNLRDDISGQQAVDRAWMLTGVELYLNAVDGCGWSDTDYQRWLAGLLRSQLLGPT